MVHKLLWTGGFDSTFRLCELVKEKCTIQPVYIINRRRESVVFELQAQEKILNYLSKNSNVKAKILSVDYYDVKDIPFDLDVFNAFQRILMEYPTIVKQYDYLSQCAKFLPHCDLCQEKFYGRTTAINRLFNDKAVLVKDKFGNIVIDKVKSDNIPVIFHIELSNSKIADTIASETGTKVLKFNSAHNITKDEFDKGVTYVDLMKDNIKVLKEALN